MTAGRSLLDHQREASAAKDVFATALERRRLLREGWSEAAIDCYERFGVRQALLYEYVSHEQKYEGGTTTNLNAVRVEGIGPATLLRVGQDTPSRGGAMVLPLRPRAFIEEWKDGKRKERAAAVFVNIADVKPFLKGDG